MAFLFLDNKKDEGFKMHELETQLSQINHFQFVHAHLFSSGQPAPEQLAQIKAYGVSTLINIAPSRSPEFLAHEDQLCLDLGLNYIHIPLCLELPSPEQCILILDLIQHLVSEQMLWLHCSHNHQVSCLIYLYRQYYLNMDIATAHDLLHAVWQPNETWTGLMHAVALQLQGRRATEELNQSLQHNESFSSSSD